MSHSEERGGMRVVVTGVAYLAGGGCTRWGPHGAFAAGWSSWVIPENRGIQKIEIQFFSVENDSMSQEFWQIVTREVTTKMSKLMDNIVSDGKNWVHFFISLFSGIASSWQVGKNTCNGDLGQWHCTKSKVHTKRKSWGSRFSAQKSCFSWSAWHLLPNTVPTYPPSLPREKRTGLWWAPCRVRPTSPLGFQSKRRQPIFPQLNCGPRVHHSPLKTESHLA